MGDQGKAFDEVRALLGKMDRSIDEARSRRLGTHLPKPSENSSDDAHEKTTEQMTPTTTFRNTPPAPVPGQVPQRSRSSKYGRARPINRNGDNGPTNPTGQWAPPPNPRPVIDDDTMIG